MPSLDSLIHQTRNRIADTTKSTHELLQIEIALEDAKEAKKTAKFLAITSSKQLDTISTFCQWFKLNPGCVSCPMWQQGDDLKWRCTL